MKVFVTLSLAVLSVAVLVGATYQVMQPYTTGYYPVYPVYGGVGGGYGYGGYGGGFGGIFGILIWLFIFIIFIQIFFGGFGNQGQAHGYGGGKSQGHGSSYGHDSGYYGQQTGVIGQTIYDPLLGLGGAQPRPELGKK